MSGLNHIKDLDKQLSNLSTLSESHKTTKHSTKWIIQKSDIKKNIATVGRYLQTNWIYKEPENIQYYYLIFYPNGQDNSSKGSSLITIVFYEIIPENACVEVELCVQGLNIIKKFDVRSATQKQDIELIETEDLRVHTAVNNLIIHCLITNVTHFAECEIDGRKVSSKQNKKPYDIFRCLSGLSDVTIYLVNNEKCEAVKALLVKVPYFRKLFDGRDNNQTNNTHQSVYLTDIEMHKYVFDEFLYYLYTNNLPRNFDFKLAYELYALAHYFEFFELKNLCFTFLGANLTEKNVLIVLQLAHKNNDMALKKVCFQFIKDSDPDTLAKESVLQF